MNTKILLAACLLACATACSQEGPAPVSATPPASGTVPASAQAASAPRASLAPGAIGDAMFSISPGTFRICEAATGAIAATATWDVTARNITEVSIYVVDAKGQRKLWLDGGGAGASTTGPWVFPGTTFQLVEQGGGKAIAELTVKATPCE